MSGSGDEAALRRDDRVSDPSFLVVSIRNPGMNRKHPAAEAIMSAVNDLTLTTRLTTLLIMG